MKVAKKRKVLLSGELAKRFGAEHILSVATPAEAVRALCANFPDFYNFVAASEARNVGYKVILDADEMPGLDHLGLPFAKTMQIVPVIGGAKSGLVGIVLGAALIAASFYLPGAALFAGAPGALGTVSFASVAFGIGTSLVLGGVLGILSPQPKATAGGAEATNKPSYTFNGPVNTSAQGNPVPVGYGRMIVGSAVVSAGITADDYSAAGVE